MTIEGQKFYPGATATPEQLIQLASEYRSAAEMLSQRGRRGQPMSRAPFRLVAIHAIELYLNALVLKLGHPPDKVRGMHHDLAARAELAMAANLKLRKRTLLHLQVLSHKREYLITRYDPAVSAASELNRLTATLKEIADKVTCMVSLGSTHI